MVAISKFFNCELRIANCELVLGAAAALSMLSPVVSNSVEIEIDEKLEIDTHYPR